MEFDGCGSQDPEAAIAVDGCGVRELDGVGPLSSLSSGIVSNFEGSFIGERRE